MCSEAAAGDAVISSTSEHIVRVGRTSSVRPSASWHWHVEHTDSHVLNGDWNIGVEARQLPEGMSAW